ncbi:MAG: hypothetical protein A2583_10035 [Bdellovibrionales bacterium RIFOXYD1_FULL_53_11]|nr:MAG: hypothetical protein A2583_10035 [Bdellovibrionales bacterium RIFOXYD1_FULL_53_11]
MKNKILLVTTMIGLCLAPANSFGGVEIGASLGMPAGLNLHLGYWGGVLVRATGMYWQPKMQGAQGEFGWNFARSGNVWQYFGLCGLTMKTSGYEFTGGGLSYGLNASGFALTLGLVGGKPGGNLKMPTFITIQIGYAYLGRGK